MTSKKNSTPDDASTPDGVDEHRDDAQVSAADDGAASALADPVEADGDRADQPDPSVEADEDPLQQDASLDANDPAP